MNPAATTADSDRYNIPPKNELLFALRYPTTYGPTNPPRLPIEFINPIEAAAAGPARMVVGSAQKEGKKLYNPAAAIQNMLTARAVLL